MSAEIPTPAAEAPPSRRQVVRSNRQQLLLFAVGKPNSLEARFAAKLASVLKNTSSKLRLKVVSNADNPKALAQFDRRQADLVVLRTDAKVPPRARALA